MERWRHLPEHKQAAYEKKTLIQTGSLCEVWLIQRLCDGKEFVAKITRAAILKAAVDTKCTKENVLQEAHLLQLIQRIAARSDHAGAALVMRLRDEFVHRDEHWLVMDRAKSGDLLTWFLESEQKGRPLSRNQFVSVAEHLLHALSFLHSIGVAHLDVKPENVLVMGSGHPTLTDFGMARVVLESSSSGFSNVLVRQKGPVGTRLYMAPECYHNLEFDPFAADIWSAGLVLFILATGSHAYERPETSDPRFQAIWYGKAGLQQLLHALEIQVDEDIVDFLLHMLCPEERRWSADQLLLALNKMSDKKISSKPIEREEGEVDKDGDVVMKTSV
jgi:serine/threonine protein kinase